MTDRNSDFERGLRTLQEGGTGDLPVILPFLQLAGVHVIDFSHGQTIVQLR